MKSPKPTIYNLVLTALNTEYSQALVGSGGYIQKLTVLCRTAADMKLAYTLVIVEQSILLLSQALFI